MTYLTTTYTRPNLHLPPMETQATEHPSSEIDYANKMHQLARKENRSVGKFCLNVDEARVAREADALAKITAFLRKNPGSGSRQIMEGVEGIGEGTFRRTLQIFRTSGQIERPVLNTYYAKGEAPE